MNIENLKSQMRKGLLDFCVLLILNRRAAYASELIAELKSARMIVVEGTLYPLLTRLKNEGLLAYEWRESNAGPPRKYYVITPVGAALLDRLSQTWDEMSATIDLLKSNQKTVRQI